MMMMRMMVPLRRIRLKQIYKLDRLHAAYLIYTKHGVVACNQYKQTNSRLIQGISSLQLLKIQMVTAPTSQINGWNKLNSNQ